MSPPNDEEAQPNLASVEVSDLSQRTCVFLHKVLKQVQKDMDTEVDNGGKTRGWKMTEIQTMLHAYGMGSLVLAVWFDFRGLMVVIVSRTMQGPQVEKGSY
jgi:hypothetical protein